MEEWRCCRWRDGFQCVHPMVTVIVCFARWSRSRKDCRSMAAGFDSFPDISEVRPRNMHPNEFSRSRRAEEAVRRSMRGRLACIGIAGAGFPVRVSRAAYKNPNTGRKTHTHKLILSEVSNCRLSPRTEVGGELESEEDNEGFQDVAWHRCFLSRTCREQQLNVIIFGQC